MDQSAKAVEKKTVGSFPDAKAGRTYLVIGPYCWGRDPNAKRAHKLATANFSRTLFKPEFKPSYQLIDVPEGTYVNDYGWFVLPDAEGADRSWEWLGAYSKSGAHLPTERNPFKLSKA